MGYIELHGRKWYGVTVRPAVADILSKRLAALQTEYVSVPQGDGRLFIGGAHPTDVLSVYANTDTRAQEVRGGTLGTA